MEIAYLSLGTNLGDRLANLQETVNLLNTSEKVEVLKVSTWLENPAIEGAGPEDFLNGALKLQTDLTALELLDLIRTIENRIDPDRDTRGRKLARKIDIDILLYGQQIIDVEGLTVPHPRMQDRYFIMQPLREIEADLDTLISNLVKEELV